MDRRAFLRLTGVGGAVLAAAPRALFAAANESVAPARFALSKVGVQLYTMRSLMEKDPGGTLARVAGAGYRIVETAGFYGLEPAAFKKLLDRAGLRAPSGHYPLDQLEGKPDTVFAAARALGHEWIVLPYLDKSLRGSADSFTALAERLNRLGKQVKDAGFHFAYHNHDFEFDTFGGTAPAYDTLLSHTDPAVVGFELDAYWVYKAGHDPIRYLERNRGRFPLCHLKDGTAAPARDMTEVGKGVIDFRRLFAAAPIAGLRYAFVEHDHASDPVASISDSHEYLQRILGAPASSRRGKSRA
jgi:sugar phosphate isomerase/epimerase